MPNLKPDDVDEAKVYDFPVTYVNLSKIHNLSGPSWINNITYISGGCYED